MKSNCATNLPGVLARGSGHLPELLEEGARPSLGEVLVCDHFANLTTETDLSSRFAFQSLKLDPSELLFAAQTRCDDPTPGCWMQKDPVGFAAGDANLYRCVHTEARGILLNHDGTICDA